MEVDDAQQTPDRVERLLEQCRALSDEERSALLKGLGASASLRAWDAGAKVPDGSAPAPARPSWPALISEPGSRSTDLTGCPWCRRPLRVEYTATWPPAAAAPSSPSSPPRCAYVTLLYGPRCHAYFLGALTLGWGLRTKTAPGAERVLLHTRDVPPSYLEVLAASGWQCREVEYLSDVSGGFFHNWRKSRFVDVFTKLRALELTTFDKVMLLDLDMLVRRPVQEGQCLTSLFKLPAPAAMKRGNPVRSTGDSVDFVSIWEHPTRREPDRLPPHQQASGINAGVMLLKPDAAVFKQMAAEIRDWYHPEHYATYMPEQEYLGRFYSTFDRWTHVDCRYNFEVDKNERVPHDWTDEHAAIRAAGDAAGYSLPGSSHPGVVVLHYSGTGVKPWSVLFDNDKDKGTESLRVGSVQELEDLYNTLHAGGPDQHLEGYEDKSRLWSAILEWLAQLLEVSASLAAAGSGAGPLDALSRVRERMAVAAAEASKDGMSAS